MDLLDEEAMTISAVAITDPGLVRAVNEDAVAVQHARDDARRDFLAVVADGMGGHGHGDVASRLAVEAVMDAYEHGATDMVMALRAAVQAANTLEGEGIRATVVSMPCSELFVAQDESYRSKVLGSAPRVAVEAAVELGWEKWIGPNGAFIGMRGFGASAPGQHLYKHFGITAVAVASAARELIGKSQR